MRWEPAPSLDSFFEKEEGTERVQTNEQIMAGLTKHLLCATYYFMDSSGNSEVDNVIPISKMGK
jgi:hypothetical protein